VESDFSKKESKGFSTYSKQTLLLYIKITGSDCRLFSKVEMNVILARMEVEILFLLVVRRVKKDCNGQPDRNSKEAKILLLLKI